MEIILIIYAIIALYGIKLRKNDNNDYMSKYTTTSIKGIFAVMILLSHFSSYINIHGTIYNFVISLFGQLMVTPFLFYSGYGIMESINNKKNYMENFLKNRFLKTLFHFDIAIFLFIIVSLIVNTKYSVGNYLLSFTGWVSIGNSNWFVFDILVLYLITYISYKFFYKNQNHFLLSVSVLSLLFIMFLVVFKTNYWYDTIMCYVCGMYYSQKKEYIESIILKQHKYTSLILLISFFIILFIFRSNIIVYEILGCIFCLLIVNITFILKIGNKVLYFLGVYSFEIYILQRIPYILLSGIFRYDVFYFIASAIITICIAILFKHFTSYIDDKVYNKKE